MMHTTNTKLCSMNDENHGPISSCEDSYTHAFYLLPPI
jgi:hypothetical protein